MLLGFQIRSCLQLGCPQDNFFLQALLQGDKNAQMADKNLSTFYATNLMIAQQYKERRYETHLELITVLLVVEKHNKLLMKNHNARPTGTQGAPKAYIIQNRIDNDGKGKYHRGGPLAPTT